MKLSTPSGVYIKNEVAAPSLPICFYGEHEVKTLLFFSVLCLYTPNNVSLQRNLVKAVCAVVRIRAF